MDLMKMMGKARELQGRMGSLQDELAELSATGESGAGAVTATLTGQMALSNVTIDPSLLKPEDAGIVEDLVVAAVADARAKVEILVKEHTEAAMGDLGLPAGFKLPFGT